MAKKREEIIERKSLPHNDEAERAVLGMMIRSKEKCHEALGLLSEDDFFPDNVANRAIFSAIERLDKRGDPIDAQTIINELINANKLEVSGGAEYLLELTDSVVVFTNFKQYVDIIVSQALLRRYLVKINGIVDDYYTKDIGDVSSFLGEADRSLREIAERRKVGNFAAASEIVERVQKELDEMKNSPNNDGVIGTPSGYRKLDSYTHGFKKGELIILAARPGVGKTSLALNFMYNAAMRDIPVGYFSLEMNDTDLAKRLISGEANIPFNDFLTGFGLQRNNVRLRINEACNRIAKCRMYIDQTSGIVLNDLVAKIRLLYNREPDLGLIIVDYIGLISPGKKMESRQNEIQLISQTLKKVALELSIPIIAVAQLNRKVDERGGEPMASDLRESGSLEQDADIILMLHESKTSDGKDNAQKSIFEKNEEEVNKAQDAIAKQEGGKETTIVNLKIAKNRSGQCTTLPLLFRKNYCKFDSPSSENEEKLIAINNERIRYYSND